MAQYGTALLRYYQGMKVNDVAQALRTTRSGGEASAQAGQ